MSNVNVVYQEMAWRICMRLAVKKTQISTSHQQSNIALLKHYHLK
ncbi:MAG: hypothetical protein RLZZ384_331 [Pseudomonadota bacterium]|jgi:hypothetical protein